MAINPATPASTLEEILPDLELVLVMTVNPGFGGQEFLAGTLPKIRRVRQMIDLVRPDCELEVDGGIEPHTAPGSSRPVRPSWSPARRSSRRPAGPPPASPGSRQGSPGRIDWYRWKPGDLWLAAPSIARVSASRDSSADLRGNRLICPNLGAR